MSITDAPVAVVVFGQLGCPACDVYIPRFRAVATRYGRCVPSWVLDSARYTEAADSLGVRETPTTYVLRYGRPASRPLVGDAPEASIEDIFRRAMRGLECTL